MFPVLFSHGPIGVEEGALLVDATLLMLIVVVPVIALLFFFAWRYRAGSSARYEPEWEHSRMDELIWWAVPLEIVLVLSAVIWTSSHALDPHRMLPSSTPSLNIEVVALDGRWLFIYPSLGIATVNYLPIPAGVPLQFSVTADAPMNSFWIPALGGQVYAMTGMDNPLSLEAASPGQFDGFSANYSGVNFSRMHFLVDAMPSQNFMIWADAAHHGTTTLGLDEYDALAQGADASGVYASTTPGLFNAILQKYRPPEEGHHH